MKIFLDTEFIEDGRTIDLISIGMIREDNKTYYAQNLECQFSKAEEWVRNNVFTSLTDFSIQDLIPTCKPPHNKENRCVWRDRTQIKNEILEFSGDKPIFYGYYCDYDWVVLCQLFGRMIDLPTHFPRWCWDLKQHATMFDVKLPKQAFFNHNALEDAKWNKESYECIQKVVLDLI